MNNIYIEIDENFRVTKIHRMPFDANNGMGYTREELERKGFFVNSIPEPAQYIGKRAIPMYNPDINEIYYEYTNIPLSDKERIDQLENALDFILRNSYYGTDAIATLSLDDSDNEKETNDINSRDKLAATYLANQIIAGKLKLEECITNIPQFESTIREILLENS